ncbi:hypothetical protein ACHAWO_010173 [Cyclotella atomus]|uniref:Uncharacterized protein n=1 Tax=Cyclotella atomus TaxID=382360 RepID=A0ABD3NID1_9STRA
MDRGITGNFEVIVVTKSDEKVIHSKRKGMGRAESSRERQLIVDQIREALEAV